MSGHSKWHNIQAKKGKADAARGAVFTKIGREIAIAVREGGANPESNGKLRDIIAKAKANNMPNDNIQRSIKKASGELSNVVYEEITYEGYAPGGVAVIDGDRVTATYGKEDGIDNLETLTVCAAPNGDILVGSNGGGIYVISG